MARVLLASVGAKQSDLADRLSMDNGTISRALNGKRKWTLAELETMADYFERAGLPVLRRPGRHSQK